MAPGSALLLGQWLKRKSLTRWLSASADDSVPADDAPRIYPTNYELHTNCNPQNGQNWTAIEKLPKGSPIFSASPDKTSWLEEKYL